MKRIAAGFLWFLVLYFGITGLGGAVVETIEGQGLKNTRQGYQARFAAGQAFGKKYGTIIVIVAASAAALGTVTSRLPGTKPKGS